MRSWGAATITRVIANGWSAAARRLFIVSVVLGTAACGSGSDRVASPIGAGVVWTRVTDAADAPDPCFPDWRSGRILFTYATGGTRRLAVVREDGSGLVFLPSTAGRDSSARWITDSTLVESSDRAGSFDLWVRDTTASSALRALTAYPEGELHPAPRPGAPGVAYVEDLGASRRLALLPDTAVVSPQRIHLTGTGLLPREPDWDPTGQRICFSADSANGSRHVWMVSLTDTIPRQLTTGPYRDDAPRFSPDGTRILFVSDRMGRSGLWTVSPEGEAVSLRAIVFGHTGATLATPCWSPDGTRIAVSWDGRGYGRAIWILSDLP